MTAGYFEQHDTTLRIYGYGRSTDTVHVFCTRIVLFKDGSFFNELFAYRAPNDCQNAPLYQIPPGEWGAFKISNDTLIAQVVQRFYSYNGGGWGLSELKYKIIDPSMLQRIGYRNLFPGDSHLSPREEKEQKTINMQPWRFVPCDKIKPVNYWLKNEDWFRCRRTNDVTP